MVWIEVEEDFYPWVLVAGLIALASGAAVWWYEGLIAAFGTYLVVGIVVLAARKSWLMMRLPRDVRFAANRVLEWYRERFPHERVDSVAVRAVEPGRFIIAVRHGYGRPTSRSNFAIVRPALNEIMELPSAAWRVRGLK